MIQAMFPEVRLRQLSITDSMPTSDYSTAYDARAAAVRARSRFLIKLDMKPCVHLVEICIFSLNHVIADLPRL